MAIYQDNFNRADGAIGGNWTNVQGTFGIATNKAKALTGGGDSRALSAYTAGTFAADQYAQCVMQGSGNVCGVAARSSNGVYTCYGGLASSTNCYIQKIVSGTVTNIATTATGFA